MLLLLTVIGCREEMFKDDLAGWDANSNLALYEVQLTGPGQSSGEIYLDLGTGVLYNYAQAVQQPEKIDLIMFWSTSSASNLISPNNVERLEAWATGRNINQEWFVKNETHFIRLEQSEAGQKLYDDIKSMEDILPAYATLKTLVEDQANYDVGLHGEGLALGNVGVGDIIGIKTSKNVYAIAKVQSITTGNSGNLRLSVKVDKRHEIQIAPVPPSEVMQQFTFNVEGLSAMSGSNLIDLSGGDQWSIKEGYYSQHNVDAAIYQDGNGITIASTSRTLPMLNDDVIEIRGDWEVHNETEFIRLKASDETTALFTETFTNTLIREAFERGGDLVETYPDYEASVYGPGLSVGGLAIGDVILYHSEAKNIYGMIRITEVGANHINGQVKANIYNKLEVAAPLIREFTATGSTSTTAGYFDFKNNVMYTTQAEAGPNSANIDVLSIRTSTGTGTGHNLAPLTNNAILNAWGSGAWLAVVERWPTRNTADLYRLENAQEALELYHSLTQDESMWTAFEAATAAISSTQRLTNITSGQVLFVHSVDRNLLIALKVMDSTSLTSITYRYKIIEL